MYRQKESIWDVETNNNYEKVTEFINEKSSNIIAIRKGINDIKDLFKDYIQITKTYCTQIASLALKLKPLANTIWGDLTQAIQGILLFNSISLENLAKGMGEIFKNSKMKKKDSGVSGLEEFSNIYQVQLSDLISNYCLYITELEKYERYLMNKEMGFDNDVNSNSNKGENNKDNTNNTNNTITQSSTPNDNKIEKLTNNLETVLSFRKKYLDKVGPINALVHKLVEFGIKEEKLLNEEFLNISKIFVGKLNECLEGQKKKYEDQNSVLLELYNKIKSEKFDNINSGIQEYSLHSLSIYINAKNLDRNKIKNGKQYALNQKGEEFEIYKNITLKNVENIMKEIKRNGLEIKEKDLEDFEIEKVKDFISKKVELMFNKTDDNFNDEDKNQMIKYFQENDDYILFFLQLLNNDRAKGGEIFNINIFKYIGEIFKNINDIVLKKDNYKYFNYVSILSLTYFIQEGNKKKYVYECIKDNKKLKDLNFWQKYAKFIIKYETDKIPKEKENEINNKSEKLKLTGFANILAIVNNMVNFGLEQDFIDKFISFCATTFSLTTEQIQQIKEFIPIWSEK
jgi:hypothetical protein